MSLEKILRNLKENSRTLRRIEEKLDTILTPARMIMLPERLRKTMIAVEQLGKATATQVAEKTGRSRATESDNLNQLVRIGYLKKWKVGRTAYFTLSGSA